MSDPHFLDEKAVANPKLWTLDWVGGKLSNEPEFCSHFQPSSRPIFDLASLTKIVVTGTLMAEQFAQSSQTLNEFFKTRLIEELPILKNTSLHDVTVGQLWEHRSGLQAHRLIFSKQRENIFTREQRSQLWQRFFEEMRIEKLSPEKGVVYSDLGFILLGAWLEKRSQSTLEKLFEDWKHQHHLNVTAPTLRFGVDPSHIQRVPPTESRHPVAEVNDDNCFAMGGVSSHAGLFGSVDDLWSWLRALQEWSMRIPKLNLEFLNLRSNFDRFHAGWDTPTRSLGKSEVPALPSQAGRLAPHGTLGHLGFTGTALWWNPKTLQAGVLLSNRVRPNDSTQSRLVIRKLREEFFSEIWQNKELGGEAWKLILNQNLTMGICDL